MERIETQPETVRNGEGDELLDITYEPFSYQAAALKQTLEQPHLRTIR
jgi:hypothetical protein